MSRLGIPAYLRRVVNWTRMRLSSARGRAAEFPPVLVCEDVVDVVDQHAANGSALGRVTVPSGSHSLPQPGVAHSFYLFDQPCRSRPRRDILYSPPRLLIEVREVYGV